MKAPPEVESTEPCNAEPFMVTRESVSSSQYPVWSGTVRQLVRFGFVGSLNTLVDVLLLNTLFWLFPTQNPLLLAAWNSLAYGLGAINSFVLNKYWTFGRKQHTTFTELVRFALMTCLGILVNDGFVWGIGKMLAPFIANPTLWTNVSKILAISGSTTISYLGMRLWVFTRNIERQKTMHPSTSTDRTGLPASMSDSGSTWSLSVVLPAHNEEQIITSTVTAVLAELNGWNMDFEIIVVDDGSTDRTGHLVAALAQTHHQVRLVTHEVNRGYGAALVSGFATATKDLTFFMDSDGQFRISDLHAFFPFIEEYDAVLGYRLKRQDSLVRKCNAWGWKQVIRLVLGVRVRDIDCAFKLFHTRLLRDHPLETGSALINAELLYKLARAGCVWKEVGVHHLPRQGGRATGANPKVILRAFRDLFTYARRWRREEHKSKQTTLIHEHMDA
jgi:putative flippase GtrA